MIEVSFQNDGKVKIFAYDNGDTFSVTTSVNKLVDVVPKSMLEGLRDRMVQFLEETKSVERMRIVGGAK